MIHHQYILILAAFVAMSSLTSCDKQQDTAQQNKSASETQYPLGEKSPNLRVTKVSFNEHIQPILSEACYHCHGPDSGSREPGGPISKDDGQPLRLDQEKYAFEKRKNGKPVIIPGNPDDSLLIQLMESDDPDLVMPLHPTRSPHGTIMDPEKISLVRQWIKEGAKYEPHWAYITPKKHPLPEVADSDWAENNPIDRFIAARFENRGLEPNPEENSARLIRRLYFDLTGLPPTLEDLDEILNDTRDFDTVYGETVNKLLKTDSYAEHWTRHWLDVARYADTHGYQLDNYRSVWPYRDWVINAFKNNMPFDQFTREQIAGDMIPKAKIEQVIATGFNRCLPTNGEAGSITQHYLER
ncbi:MAG TPA: hypothetical protein DHV60_09430, partial [Verrucomicrobiales bacterium]|nr:hypothetical protein [Verrucomicrobiales bacterium]